MQAIKSNIALHCELMFCRKLDNNGLGCECSTVGSLFEVIDVLSAATSCASPIAVQGVLFATSQASNPLHFTKIDKKLLQCSKLYKTCRVIL